LIDPAGALPDQTNRESAVGKWGDVRMKDIKAIDKLPAWNDSWPTLSVQNYKGGKQLKLSCAALSWSVKNMVNTLAADSAIVNQAAALRRSTAPGR